MAVNTVQCFTDLTDDNLDIGNTKEMGLLDEDSKVAVRDKFHDHVEVLFGFVPLVETNYIVLVDLVSENLC